MELLYAGKLSSANLFSFDNLHDKKNHTTLE